MRPFRVHSLRTQLALLGFAAVLIPLFVLVVVVFVSTSEEDIGQAPSGDGGPVLAESTTSDGMPPEVLVAAGILAVGVVSVVWWWSGRAVAPIETITDIAREIQLGSLDRRIELRGAAAEVEALADSFDGMLDRLAVASATQQQLIEDASHELRTPLAALAINNEVILNAADPTIEDHRSSAERNETLIARLQLTIDDLLVGARARGQSVRQVDNDLMAIVNRVADQHRSVNPDVMVEVHGPADLLLGIDGPSVQRALVNLLENAARYSPPGVPVVIDVSDGDEPRLSVTDHGPGIAPQDLDHIFDRYYGSSTSGAGIGLAVVKQVADAHGRIEVTSPLPDADHGTRFTITFAREACVDPLGDPT